MKVLQKTIYVFLFFIAANLGGGMQAQSADLSVAIAEDLTAAEGDLYLMLFNSAEGFPREIDRAWRKVKLEPRSGLSYVFRAVPYDEYAVVIFLDENRNGTIDTNLLGIPKERVGASKMNGMGRPNFQKSAIAVRQPSVRHTIKFIN